MWINEQQALEIYAEFCCARYGIDAQTKALDQAEMLHEAGDNAGRDTWK